MTSLVHCQGFALFHDTIENVCVVQFIRSVTMVSEIEPMYALGQPVKKVVGRPRQDSLWRSSPHPLPRLLIGYFPTAGFLYADVPLLSVSLYVRLLFPLCF